MPLTDPLPDSELLRSRGMASESAARCTLHDFTCTSAATSTCSKPRSSSEKAIAGTPNVALHRRRDRARNNRSSPMFWPLLIRTRLDPAFDRAARSTRCARSRSACRYESKSVGAWLIVSGRFNVSELLAPLLFCSGATTITSPSGRIASASAARPGPVAVIVGDKIRIKKVAGVSRSDTGLSE